MSVAMSTLARSTKGYLANQSVKLAEVIGLAPVVAIAAQDLEQGKANAIVSAYKRLTDGTLGRAVASTTCTAVANEHTITPHGDTTTLDFAGTITNTPVVPKSVEIHQDSDDAVIAKDGGDGHFYTNDSDLDECGTINYFTGAMVLYFPAGKAPGTGELDQGYLYEDAVCKYYGRKAYTWTSLSPGESLIINGACPATDVDSKACGSTLVHTDILVGGDATSVGGVA